MFRRIISVLLILSCLVSLPLYSRDASADSVRQFNTKDQDLLNMSTYMNGGLGTVSGKTYFGAVYKGGKKAGTGKLNLASPSSRFVLFGGTGSYLSVYKKYLYYTSYSSTDRKYSINRITTTGKKKKTLVSTYQPIKYMFIYKGTIYFSVINTADSQSTTGRLYRMSLNGKNRKILLNKPVCFPYIIDDHLIYQDDRDKCRLHICDLNGKNDSILIDDVVFSYIADGSSVYYKTLSKKPSFNRYGNMVWPSTYKEIIKKYDLRTGKSKTIISDNVGFFGIHGRDLYYSNDSDLGRLYRYNLRSGKSDAVSKETWVLPYIYLKDGIVCYTEGVRSKYDKYFYLKYDNHKKTTLR